MLVSSQLCTHSLSPMMFESPGIRWRPIQRSMDSAQLLDTVTTLAGTLLQFFIDGLPGERLVRKAGAASLLSDLMQNTNWDLA